MRWKGSIRNGTASSSRRPCASSTTSTSSRASSRRIWRAPHNGYSSDNTEETPTLDTLRSALSESDRWYCDYLRRSPAVDLSEQIAFTFTDGDKGFMSREEMLTHVALHAGYHRGEVGRLLWQLGITPPWDTFAVYLHRAEPSRRLQGEHATATT